MKTTSKDSSLRITLQRTMGERDMRLVNIADAALTAANAAGADTFLPEKRSFSEVGQPVDEGVEPAAKQPKLVGVHVIPAEEPAEEQDQSDIGPLVEAAFAELDAEEKEQQKKQKERRHRKKMPKKKHWCRHKRPTTARGRMLFQEWNALQAQIEDLVKLEENLRKKRSEAEDVLEKYQRDVKSDPYKAQGLDDAQEEVTFLEKRLTVLNRDYLTLAQCASDLDDKLDVEIGQ